MEVAVTTGAISCAKLQSYHHHQQTNIQSFYRPDALPVANQQCQSTEGKISHYMDLLTPSSPTLSLTTNSSWLPWGRVAMSCLSSTLWCQYPDCTIMSQWPTFMVGAVNDVHKTRNQQTRKTFHRFYPPANTYHTYIQYLKSTKSATSCQPESGK